MSDVLRLLRVECCMERDCNHYWCHLAREAADTIEIMAREIADLKAQHLLTQAEEMHRIVREAESR